MNKQTNKWMKIINIQYQSILAGLSIFLKYTSTSLFTGGTFPYNLNILHEYLMQHFEIRRYQLPF